MPRTKLVNGIRIAFTAEEEAQRDAEEAQALVDKQNEEQAKADAEAKKASGKQKLKDLGLDDAEINALMGV
tara:strand:- start:1483 stop:1695 length:213 start_codon:yes stop_codon:yes gene_type:complete